MRVLARVRDPELRKQLAALADRTDTRVVFLHGAPTPALPTPRDPELRPGDVLLIQLPVDGAAEDDRRSGAGDVDPADGAADGGRRSGAVVAAVRAAVGARAAVLLACTDVEDCDPALLERADDWLLLPCASEELEARLRGAARGESGDRRSRYRELLHDTLTGLPTLPVMVDRAGDMLEQVGELTVLYVHFVRYEKIEELFGWQKLDDVLESTAGAVRAFYEREHPAAERRLMVSRTGDDDFILFTRVPTRPPEPERRLPELARKIEVFLMGEIERAHGEEIAALCGIYVGASALFRNPTIRTERLIYRGIREAAEAARGAERRALSRRVSDLEATLREGAVFMEYHPIIVTETRAVYGYEALARGVRRALRSPEVLLDVAAEADLSWELGRLLRRRAVRGIVDELGAEQHLFLNVDPHDFDDPEFHELSAEALGIDHAGRVVLEITERTAIEDYPRFQGHIAALRGRGFKFAVDDAGSGYAGLGSIANLEPDYIKLDISLISSIDSNALKQSLVETMVGFAENHGALVVAEGVEREEEYRTVREIGVHLTQGFYFHKPRFGGAPAPAAGT